MKLRNEKFRPQFTIFDYQRPVESGHFYLKRTKLGREPFKHAYGMKLTTQFLLGTTKQNTMKLRNEKFRPKFTIFDYPRPVENGHF